MKLKKTKCNQHVGKRTKLKWLVMVEEIWVPFRGVPASKIKVTPIYRYDIGMKSIFFSLNLLILPICGWESGSLDHIACDKDGFVEYQHVSIGRKLFMMTLV